MLVIVVAIIAVCSMPIAAEPVKLSDFEWQNRLLVACDLRPSDVPPRERVTVATAASIALEDLTETDGARKLALVSVSNDSWTILIDARNDPPAELATLDYICPDCGYAFLEDERAKIVNRLACTPDGPVLALIGLDGAVKKTWRKALPQAEEVFALIDAMPMRQLELQNAQRD